MLVSSNQDEKEMIKCLKLGANDYIKKPFSNEELKVRVNNILELYDGFRKAVKNSQIDKLTGVFNRNYLESDFENIFNSFDNKSIAPKDVVSPSFLLTGKLSSPLIHTSVLLRSLFSLEKYG